MAALPTVRDALAAALDAYATLTSLGEDVEDEWSYVTDLSAAWRSRIDDVMAQRGGEAAPAAASAAIDQLCTEIGRITDPHRAIDWLSTFPQVVLAAIGERP